MSGGIGTLGEKTLHARLKALFEPDTDAHEVRVGPYVADIVGEQGIIEIQTGNFQALRKKLPVFLEAAPVTVVYPLVHRKWLCWVDPENGNVTARRKSPRTGGYPDAMRELYKIRPLLSAPGLRLILLLIDMEEYRLRNGWSEDKKKGSTRYERIPLEIAGQLELHCPGDWLLPQAQAAFFPAGLPAPFTSKDYAKAARLSISAAQTALRVLADMGAAQRSGKQGNAILYHKAEEGHSNEC